MTKREANGRTLHDVDHDDCLICDDTGHHESCESREPAWDIGDLVCRYPCDGCCPNGCKPHGLQAMQDDMQQRANGLLGRLSGKR